MATHDPQALQRWTTIIADWRSSGLSITAFCRSLGVNKSGFHRWRNIIDQLERDDQRGAQHGDQRIQPRDASNPTGRRRLAPSTAKTFVPVRVVADHVVEVILPSGVQLRVPLAADAQQLARLVAALAGGDASC